MQKIFITFIFFLFPMLLISMSPKEALQELIDGNQRYYQGQQNWIDHQYQRKSTKNVQEPFAVIVCCSDSRVSPEILFDQGIGELFVVRVAGNVIGNLELESIQYAVEHLNTPLILVYGHQACGAVNAVYEGHGDEIPAIAAKINPAVKVAKRHRNHSLRDAIELNAQLVSRRLQEKSFVQAKIDAEKLKIHAGYYDFQTGALDLLK